MYLRRCGFLYAITISRCLAFPENFCARSVNEDQDALVSLIGDSPLHESHRLSCCSPSRDEDGPRDKARILRRRKKKEEDAGYKNYYY